MVQKLYDVGSEAVLQSLATLEKSTLINTGVQRISGGFAKARVTGWNYSYIFIQLKWGVQSDCEDRVYIEKFRLNRRTLALRADD